MINLNSIIRSYKNFALILTNLIVFFVLANVALYVVQFIKDHFISKGNLDNAIVQKYNRSPEFLYQGLSSEDFNTLINETYGRNPQVSYEPYTQYREHPFTGEFVNIDKNGFRVGKNQGPWPPDPVNYNVFIFGGSTTFGYGVPDEQTVASYFQAIADKSMSRVYKIYNFGRGSYYSSQECVLFQRLLVSGVIPDMVMFIDGLNDFWHYDDEPVFSEQLSELMHSPLKKRTLLAESFKHLPLSRLVDSFRYRYGLFKKRDQQEIPGTEKMDYNPDPSFIDSITDCVIERYLSNKKIIEGICANYDIIPVFIWQPVPLYKYDIKYHLFADEGFEKHTYTRYGYPKMAILMEEISLGDNFIWCADIQEHRKEPLYVDRAHYSPQFSRELAEYIFCKLVERKILLQ
jgi:hypothetical protein